MIGAGETVTVLRPGVGVDRYGNPTKDWSNPTRIDVAGCALAPRSRGAGGQAEETSQGREGVVVAWDLYYPAGTDILPTDRVEARGDVYDIDGHPAEWTSPYSGTDEGVVVALRKVEG